MERPTLDKFPASVLAQLDIQTPFIVSRLIVATERLQIFRALHGKSMTAETIGRALGIHEFYLKPFLCSLVSLGLLRAKDKKYRNTPFTEKYFIDERPIHWTRQYSRECVEAYNALTTLERALASGKRVDRGSEETQLPGFHESRQTRGRRLYADAVLPPPGRCRGPG